MGKKIPYDVAMRISRLQTDGSIYATDNRYGYQLNINHPSIRPLYERYKQKIGVPSRIGLSDEQRRKFEIAVMKMIERKRNIDV